MFRLITGLVLFSVSSATLAQSQYLTVPEKSRPAPQALFGVWGDEAQCRAFADSATEYSGSAAYEISQNWIKQGWFHCLINWQGDWSTNNGLQAQAFAQCGEDLIREYRIVLVLESNSLQIRWTDDYSTKELYRCTE